MTNLSDFDQFTQNIEIPHLTEDLRVKLEDPLTYEECKKAISSFRNGKPPGEDGFTAEFYVAFLIFWEKTWLKVSILLMKKVNHQSPNVEK